MTEYILTLVLIIVALSSMMVILFTSNVLYGAIGLLAILLSVGGIFGLIGSSYIALSQVVLYVGGVSVLILFAVMLTKRISGEGRFRDQFTNVVPGVLVAFSIVFVLFSSWFYDQAYVPVSNSIDYTIRAVGTSLLTKFLFPFEFIGVLLLVVLIVIAFVASKRISSK